MARLLRVCVAAALLSCTPAAASVFKVGAFNVQVFGTSKVDKPDVMQTLVDTFLRWDLSCMQEIRNSDGTAFQQLLDDMNAEQTRRNAASAAPNGTYKAWLSERLGRSSSKEQQAYIYREDMFEVVDTYQYADTRDDFERPPNAVLFRRIGEDASRGVSAPFWVMCQHVTPSDVVAELQSMAQDVIPDMVAAFEPKMASVVERRGAWACAQETAGGCGDGAKLSAGLLVGDFNADCSYLTLTEYGGLDIVTTTDYYDVLIGNKANTTVGVTQCAYDRVVAVDAMQPQVVPGSAAVFNFQNVYDLSDGATKEVSDHFPVEADVVLGVLAPAKTAQDARTAWREVRTGTRWANVAWCGGDGAKTRCQDRGTIQDGDQVVVVDLFDTAAAEIRELQGPRRQKLVVCYLSAGTVEPGRVDAGNYTEAVQMDKMGDWDEWWLDIHDEGARAVVLANVAWRLKVAQAKGCDGVELDNVDCWENDACLRKKGYAGADVAVSQLAFNRALAAMAHEHDLSVGLKNDVEQVEALVDSFDFAVNEECHRYGECGAYRDTFVAQGKAVLGTEYEVADMGAVCGAAAEVGISQKVDRDGLWEDCGWNAGVRVAQAYVRGEVPGAPTPAPAVATQAPTSLEPPTQLPATPSPTVPGPSGFTGVCPETMFEGDHVLKRLSYTFGVVDGSRPAIRFTVEMDASTYAAIGLRPAGVAGGMRGLDIVAVDSANDVVKDCEPDPGTATPTASARTLSVLVSRTVAAGKVTAVFYRLLDNGVDYVIAPGVALNFATSVGNGGIELRGMWAYHTARTSEDFTFDACDAMQPYLMGGPPPAVTTGAPGSAAPPTDAPMVVLPQTTTPRRPPATPMPQGGGDGVATVAPTGDGGANGGAGGDVGDRDDDDGGLAWWAILVVVLLSLSVLAAVMFALMKKMSERPPAASFSMGAETDAAAVPLSTSALPTATSQGSPVAGCTDAHGSAAKTPIAPQATSPTVSFGKPTPMANAMPDPADTLIRPSPKPILNHPLNAPNTLNNI